MLSLYIPIVRAKWATTQKIADIFYRLNIGDVKRIDIRYQKQSGTYQVFVHFNTWFNNTITKHLQEKILSGKPAKIIYDEPRYWLVMENKCPLLTMSEQYCNANAESESDTNSEVCTECDDAHTGRCKNENYYEGTRYFEQYCI